MRYFTLQCKGGCWRKPKIDYRSFAYLTTAELSTGMFEERCKDCFPRDRIMTVSMGIPLGHLKGADVENLEERDRVRVR